MKVQIICAGHTPKPHEARWVEEYLDRAQKFAVVSLTRVREHSAGNPEQTALKTWVDLESKIPKQSFRVVLDPSGKLHSTAELSKLLDRAGRKNIAFLIGGSYGLPKSALQGADVVISLTPLTLPHRLALLILAEQLYRVLSWRAGAPYHHDS